MESIPVQIIPQTQLTVTTHPLPDDTQVTQPFSPTAVCIQFLCRCRVGGVIIGPAIEMSLNENYLNLTIFAYCAFFHVLSALPSAPLLGQARVAAFAQQLVEESCRAVAAGQRVKLSALISTTFSLQYVGVVQEVDDGMVPAAENAVKELLEKGAASVEGDAESCVICLDELPRGTQVTRLPCSHWFHGDCIARWLGRSHYCPVCRYQMPAAAITT